jgi:hypothetical protein
MIKHIKTNALRLTQAVLLATTLLSTHVGAMENKDPTINEAEKVTKQYWNELLASKKEEVFIYCDSIELDPSKIDPNPYIGGLTIQCKDYNNQKPKVKVNVDFLANLYYLLPNLKALYVYNLSDPQGNYLNFDVIGKHPNLSFLGWNNKEELPVADNWFKKDVYFPHLENLSLWSYDNSRGETERTRQIDSRVLDEDPCNLYRYTLLYIARPEQHYRPLFEDIRSLREYTDGAFHDAHTQVKADVFLALMKITLGAPVYTDTEIKEAFKIVTHKEALPGAKQSAWTKIGVLSVLSESVNEEATDLKAVQTLIHDQLLREVNSDDPEIRKVYNSLNQGYKDLLARVEIVLKPLKENQQRLEILHAMKNHKKNGAQIDLTSYYGNPYVGSNMLEMLDLKKIQDPKTLQKTLTPSQQARLKQYKKAQIFLPKA